MRDRDYCLHDCLNSDEVAIVILLKSLLPGSFVIPNANSIANVSLEPMWRGSWMAYLQTPPEQAN